MSTIEIINIVQSCESITGMYLALKATYEPIIH